MKKKDFVLFKKCKKERLEPHLRQLKRCCVRGCLRNVVILSVDSLNASHLFMKGLCSFHYNGTNFCSTCDKITRYRNPSSFKTPLCKTCGGEDKAQVFKTCKKCSLKKPVSRGFCSGCFAEEHICTMCNKNKARRSYKLKPRDLTYFPHGVNVGDDISVCNECYNCRLYVCSVSGCIQTLKSDFAMPSHGVCATHRVELFPEFDRCVSCRKRAVGKTMRCREHKNS